MRSYYHGLNHSAPGITRLQRYLCSGRPIDKTCTLLPHYQRVLGEGSVAATLRESVPLPWATAADHFRPRHSVCSRALPRVVQTTGYRVKHVNGIPSSNRRTDRTRQPSGGAVHSVLRQLQPRRLVKLITHSGICIQQPGTRRHKGVSVLLRIRKTSTSGSYNRQV